MTGFRILLAALSTAVIVYTVIVVSNHGLGLFPIFFGDIAQMAWPGQFNLDFLTFLILTGVWLAWRHEFSPAGICLGLVAPLGGMPYLAAYLFIHSYRTKGDMTALLVGESRAQSR